MKRLAMITALIAAPVVATSSLAAAQPYQPYDQPYDHDYDHDRYDHDRYGERYDQRYDQRDRYRGRWVPLARGYSAASDRQFVRVNGDRFDRLRITADRGAPVVQKVVIEYRDRNAQVVDLNTRLAPGSGETIRLNGNRGINRIIVYTEPRARGAYSIYGA